MNVKIWIAMYADYGETCDGKPRLLDVCKSRDEALAAVRTDIEKWADGHAGENVEVDFGKKSARHNGNGSGCEWSIEEHELAPRRYDMAPTQKEIALAAATKILCWAAGLGSLLLGWIWLSECLDKIVR